jgi:gas vesicle protein
MGYTMGKTIALKITEKEDQIIQQLNRQGITNSELLRTALRQYFRQLYESTSHHLVQAGVVEVDEHSIPPIQDSLEEVKEELIELREQTKRTKEQIEDDILNLHKQLYQLTQSRNIITQMGDPFKDTLENDIHDEVDEFLKKRSIQEDLLRK